MLKYLLPLAFSIFFLCSCDNNLEKKIGNAKVSSDQSAGVGIVFPVPSETVEPHTEVKLDLINNTGKKFEYLWWVRKPGNDWAAVDGWSNKTSVSVVLEELGVYHFQVDYRTKEAPDVVNKKWLGQTTVARK
jgi:hypothetical protein